MTAASVIFFAYIGFDAISTSGEEVKRPGPRPADRDHRARWRSARCSTSSSRPPRSARCPYKDLDGQEAPLAEVLKTLGFDWGATVISFGALVAITSVVLTILYGQTRIMFAMCRDGLLPRVVREDLREAPHAGAHHRDVRHPDRRAGRLRAAGGDREAGQHRHAVRVRDHQHRRDRAAPHAAGPRARLPRPVRAAVPDHRRRAGDLPHDLPRGGDLDAVRRLAGCSASSSTSPTDAGTRCCGGARCATPRPTCRPSRVDPRTISRGAAGSKPGGGAPAIAASSAVAAASPNCA